MSDFKTQEVAKMSKIFHLKLLTEKNLEFLVLQEVHRLNQLNDRLVALSAKKPRLELLHLFLQRPVSQKELLERLFLH